MIQATTRGHYACVHAVVCGLKLAGPGITTEPRGLTALQSGLLPMQQQLEQTPRRRHLIANFHATEMKSRNCVTGAFTIALSFGQRTGDRTPLALAHCSVQQTQHPARTAGTSAKSLQRRWKHELQIALQRRRAAMPRANRLARAEWLFGGIIDRALHHWGHVTPS